MALFTHFLLISLVAQALRGLLRTVTAGGGGILAKLAVDTIASFGQKVSLNICAHRGVFQWCGIDIDGRGRRRVACSK